MALVPTRTLPEGSEVTCVSRSLLRAVGEPRKRRADAERNRQQVLTTALHVLTLDPAATIDEIAQASGLGRTTVFRHFPTRDALLVEVSLLVLSRVQELFGEIDFANVNVVDGFARVAAVACSIQREFVFVSNQQLWSAAWDPGVSEQLEALLSGVRVLVERGQRLGVLRTDLPAAWLVKSFSCLVDMMMIERGPGGALAELGVEEAAGIVQSQFLHGALQQASALQQAGALQQAAVPR
jgi:TetR/AcrR family transcriptional regulator, mexCD-oprJ operon repressor